MGQTIRIGSQMASADPFWVLVREAAYQRSQALGVDLVPAELDLMKLPGEEQMRVVEELLVRELDALIAQGLSSHLIQLIVNTGVPVILVTESNFQHPLTTSPRGLYDAARMAVGYLVDRLGGRGTFLIVGGLMEGLDFGHSRLRGCRDVLKDYPAIDVTHLPAPWSHESAYEHLFEAMQELTRPVDAIFGLSDSLALVARDAAEPLGLLHNQTLIAGVNGDPLALAAIIEGRMAATVDTPAGELGCQIVDLAYQAAQGGALPTNFSYKPRLVTSENAAEVAAQKLVAIANLPSRMVGINRHQEQQRMTQLETSLAISRRVGSILDRQELSHEIANLIRSSYGYDDVQIFLWRDAEKEFVLDTPGESESGSIRIPLAGSDLLGYTLMRNQPTFIPDMHHSHRFRPDPYWPTTRSRVILPIRLGGQVLGLLDLHSRRPTQHTSEDLIGLQALSDQLAITMRNVQLYGEAVQARAEAERASQLKSRLLANVSHELRTPLNVILGYSQSALADPNPYGQSLPPALLRDLQYIYDSGEHLRRLISDLLDLSRAEVGELEIYRETIETRRFLAEVFQTMAGSAVADGQVEWRLQLPERLPAIKADPLRLRQILLNLLANAAKFTERGHITMGASATEAHLDLWVADTGRGIPPEQQALIFEAFAVAESARQAGQGIGLGLRITHELVTLDIRWPDGMVSQLGELQPDQRLTVTRN